MKQLYVRADKCLALNIKGKPTRVYQGGQPIPRDAIPYLQAQQLIAEGLLTDNPSSAVTPAEESLPTLPYDISRNAVRSDVDRAANQRLRQAKQEMPGLEEGPEDSDLTIQSQFENVDD